jgi:CO/xanthine dehydrogenase Mo-binding subunit
MALTPELPANVDDRYRALDCAVTVHDPDAADLVEQIELIVDGQVHGGVSMGIGQSFYEQLVYDENGQLLNASLADYLLPRSTDMPHIEIGHLNTPSPLNPMGSKGVGEAGAIPTPACFAQAVENALADYKLEVLETPLSPNRLFELLQVAHH